MNLASGVSQNGLVRKAVALMAVPSYRQAGAGVDEVSPVACRLQGIADLFCSSNELKKQGEPGNVMGTSRLNISLCFPSNKNSQLSFERELMLFPALIINLFNIFSESYFSVESITELHQTTLSTGL